MALIAALRAKAEHGIKVREEQRMQLTDSILQHPLLANPALPLPPPSIAINRQERLDPLPDTCSCCPSSPKPSSTTILPVVKVPLSNVHSDADHCHKPQTPSEHQHGTFLDRLNDLSGSVDRRIQQGLRQWWRRRRRWWRWWWRRGKEWRKRKGDAWKIGWRDRGEGVDC